MDIFEFVDCSNRTRSPRTLFNLLVDAASNEGFNWVAYGALNYDELVRLPGGQAPAVALNYPLQWQERYFQRKYYEIDPVIAYALSTAKPFLWDSLNERSRLEIRQKCVLGEAHEAGLKNGLSVPLLGSGGRLAIVCFASSSDEVDPQKAVKHLNVLASQFHVAFTDLAQSVQCAKPAVLLSERERECLAWTAHGKSSWDIGMILKISENTVNFHIKNSMKKLGTSSRTVAVVKAIRLSIIDPLSDRELGP
jgi:LuxR family quorum-sensing system transcriptional regulator CciR